MTEIWTTVRCRTARSRYRGERLLETLSKILLLASFSISSKSCSRPSRVFCTLLALMTMISKKGDLFMIEAEVAMGVYFFSTFFSIGIYLKIDAGTSSHLRPFLTS